MKRGEVHYYYSKGTDSDTQYVRIRLDWGNGKKSEWSELVSDKTWVILPYSWDSAGSYSVTAQAKDDSGLISDWSSDLNVTVVEEPPSVCDQPSGPDTGTVGVTYAFTASATDLGGDSVALQFDWGDGTDPSRSPLVPSGCSTSVGHSWSDHGQYLIKVRAIDQHGAASHWSVNSHSIRVAFGSRTGWQQEVVLDQGSGRTEFSGTNPHGNQGSFEGRCSVVSLPPYGGYVWRLAPDTGYGKYYQIDLTGYLWVDSVVVSYTIRAEEGGSAYTRGDFNGYWWVHPEPDNPNGWVTWELHSDGSGLRQNSADNYVLIGNAASSTCNLDLIGIGCRVYGALTSQPAVKSGISPLSSVPRPQAIPVWVSHR